MKDWTRYHGIAVALGLSLVAIGLRDRARIMLRKIDPATGALGPAIDFLGNSFCGAPMGAATSDTSPRTMREPSSRSSAGYRSSLVGTGYPACVGTSALPRSAPTAEQ